MISKALHEAGVDDFVDDLCDGALTYSDPTRVAALAVEIDGKKATVTVSGFSTKPSMLSGGQSTVVFTTSPKADRLLYFADGRLVEEGSHAELMRIQDGQYRHMWTVQAAGYQTASSSAAGEPDL
ncbi:hypothetical protein RQP46_005724 [Phenoliferia psychrophenolica]